MEALAHTLEVALVYREHAPGIERIAALEGLDAAAADDLVQRTFLAILSAADRIDGERPLGPYVATVARNLIRNDRRARAVRRRDRDVAKNVEEARSDGPIDRRVDAGALLARVLDWLAALPEPQRRALVATRIEGRSYAEVADELGSTPAALRQSVRRSVRSLCVSLGVDPDDRSEGPCPWCRA